MATWVLILFFHVGIMGDGNSNTVTNVSGFVSLQECQKAGNQAKTLTDGTVKESGFVCVQQTVR